MKTNPDHLERRRPVSALRLSVAGWTSSVLLAAGLQAGTMELISPNPVSGGGFGGSWGWTCGLPDLNGDGKGELLVSAPWETVSKLVGGSMRNYSEAGRGYVYDGATAELLYCITSPNPAANRGFKGACCAGDVNDDGVEDLMYMDEEELAGVVRFLNGKNGDPLFVLRSPFPTSPHGAFGFALGKLADVNGDGRGDWLIGEFRQTGSPGRIYVFSGVTHTPLWLKAVQGLGTMGFGCRALPDLNGDGAGEVAVGYPMENVMQNGHSISQGGLVTIFNGVNGMLLYNLTAPEPQTEDRFGERFECLDDVDGDNVPDLIVGSHWGGPNEDGRAWIFSGANGQWIRTLSCPLNYPNGRFGWHILPVPDQTGDGVMDVAILGAMENRAFVFDTVTGANVDALQSPINERFWIGATVNDGGTALGAWVFAQGNSRGSGRVYLVSETPFSPHLNVNSAAGNMYRLSFHGEMNRTYSVEASDNFEQWSEIGQLPGGPAELTVPNSAPARFFRLRMQE